MQMKLTREQRASSRYLSSATLADSRLVSSLIFLERAESARNSITAAMDGMGLGGGHEDAMCDALAKMDSAVEGIRRAAGEYADRFAEVEEAVTAVQQADGKAGMALRLVYLDGLDAEDAAEGIGCSKKTVYEHLRRGLDLAYWMVWPHE